MTVDFRPDSTGDPGEAWQAWADEQCFALIRQRSSQGGHSFVASVAVVQPTACGQVEAGEIVDFVLDRVRSGQFTTVVLDTPDELLRHQGRRLGFTGPLRSPLRLDADALRPASGRVGVGSADMTENASAPFRATHQADLEVVAAALGTLLPGRSVSASAPQSWLARTTRAAVSGCRGMVDLRVEDQADGLWANVALPILPELLLENIALACDTALGITRAFPIAQRSVSAISFDRQSPAFALKSSLGADNPRVVSGLAVRNNGKIHLNAAYATPAGVASLRRWRRDHRSKKPPRSVSPPSTLVDGVVAHEMWHMIEGAFEAHRYRDSIEFRRRIGHYFGLDTLEHVLFPSRGIPAEYFDSARARLADEVSAYATTTPKEATAELFKAWWCTPHHQPPVVQVFGELLERYFPGSNQAGQGRP